MMLSVPKKANDAMHVSMLEGSCLSPSLGSLRLSYEQRACMVGRHDVREGARLEARRSSTLLIGTREV